jgi:hypothetical protein
MTDDGMPWRRALVAAVLWIVLAFCIWNVRFDWGVRVAASQYLNARLAYEQGRGPRVELADWMDRAIADSSRQATFSAAPAIGIAFGLTVFASRRRGGSRTPSATRNDTAEDLTRKTRNHAD